MPTALKPNAEIVIANRPPRAVRIAAEELQTNLEKISVARLGIVTAPNGTLTFERRYPTKAEVEWAEAVQAKKNSKQPRAEVEGTANRWRDVG